MEGLQQQIEAVISRMKFGVASASKRGRNSEFPYVPVIKDYLGRGTTTQRNAGLMPLARKLSPAHRFISMLSVTERARSSPILAIARFADNGGCRRKSIMSDPIFTDAHGKMLRRIADGDPSVGNRARDSKVLHDLGGAIEIRYTGAYTKSITLLSIGRSSLEVYEAQIKVDPEFYSRRVAA